MVNCSIVQDKKRSRTGKWLTQRQHVVLNEIFEHLPIDSSLIDIACNVSIHSQGRKDTVVLRFRAWHWISNGLPFHRVTAISVGCPGIDPGLVHENQLIRSPVSQLL